MTTISELDVQIHEARLAKPPVPGPWPWEFVEILVRRNITDTFGQILEAFENGRQQRALAQLQKNFARMRA